MSDPDSLTEGVDERNDAELEAMAEAMAEALRTSVALLRSDFNLAHIAAQRADRTLGTINRDQIGLDKLAGLLARAREVRKALGAVEAILESWTARAMVDSKETVDGWQLVRRGGSKWRFDDDRKVLRAIVDQAMSRTGGEVTAETVYLLIDLFEQAAKPSWRTGPAGLPAVGLNPADFAERVPNRRTVQVDRVEAEQ